MVAAQYECSDVPSDNSDAWKIYYTHHKKMVAAHYVCYDVVSDDSDAWMIYYTHDK
jgi:hypothetical protein